MSWLIDVMSCCFAVLTTCVQLMLLIELHRRAPICPLRKRDRCIGACIGVCVGCASVMHRGTHQVTALSSPLRAGPNRPLSQAAQQRALLGRSRTLTRPPCHLLVAQGARPPELARVEQFPDHPNP